MLGVHKNKLTMEFEKDHEATELRLGLPGNTAQELEIRQATPNLSKSNKRQLPDSNEELLRLRNNSNVPRNKKGVSENIPPVKAQVVGWPPVRSHMKNCLQAKKKEGEGDGIFVKVSMDGAPYLRKIDLKLYKGYPELFKALENMFKFQVGGNFEREGYNGLGYVPTYEDKDGDWMLVGDVPWNMFITSCTRLRIVKGSEAKGLGCAV